MSELLTERDTNQAAEPLDLASLRQPARLREGARLYVTAQGADGALGVRRFLAALETGSAVHRLAAPKVVFLLVSDAVGTRSPSLSPAGLTVSAHEAWFNALLAADIFAMGPPDSALVEPGPTLAAARSSFLSSRALAWVRADHPVLSLVSNTADPIPLVASCLPLSPNAGVRLADAAEVSIVSTASVSESDVAAAADYIGRLAGQWHSASVVDEAGRRGDSLARDSQEFEQALQVIDATVHGIGKPPAPPVAIAADALQQALASVAAIEGIDLRRFPPLPSTADWRARLADMAAVANFRTRRVTLSGRWWREEGPSLLAEDQTGAPIALLPGRNGYRLSGSDSRTLTAQQADAIAADAVMIYPSLPETVSGRALASFAFNGIGTDIGRLVLTSLVVAALAMIIPIATGLLIGTAVPDGRIELVWQMMLILAAAAFGSASFKIANVLAQMRLATQVDWRLQAAIWDRVMRLPSGFFRDYSVGDLAVRIRAVDDIRRTLGWVTINGVMGGILSLTSLGLMLVYDLSLGLLACGYAMALALVLFVIKIKREALLRDYSKQRGIVNGLVLQLLDGIRKLRVAAAESRAFSRWARAFAVQRANSAQEGWLVNIQVVAVNGAPMLGMLAAFAIAAGRDPVIDVATFAAFSAAFGQFTAAVWTFAAALAVSTVVIPMAERLRPILDERPEVEDVRVDPGTLSGRIAMRGVGFRYRADGPWILQNIDLDIAPGSFVAIVGPSGSGKSTLLRLLLGFDVPQFGSVFYDEQDLTKLDLRRVRRQIGTVLQSTGLVPGTLFENIAGSAALPRAQVMEAAAMAGLAEDIARMPMGLETIVSEGASTLSGGQRQRVMIARALLRKPRILFFDEATSALDNRTQAVVSESLNAMTATRLVIAHRLSTVRGADTILVVEQGRIVEQGGFDVLIAARGPFYRLARRQML